MAFSHPDTDDAGERAVDTAGDAVDAAGDAAKDAGRQAESSDLLDHGVRLGLVAYGVVHLMIAFLALRLAFGVPGRKASSSGALHELAAQPYGGLLVWAVAAGMALLVVWRLLEAGFGHRDEREHRTAKRLVSCLKAVLYAAVAVSAVKVAAGASSSSDGADSMTARLLRLPAGQVLVVLVGLAVIGYGAVTAWRGVRGKHAEHLDAEGRSGQAGRALVLLGTVGYIAKGLAVAVVGVLFAFAGIQHDAQQSGGLDSALHEVLERPFGPVLLAGVALGLGCYGVFCLARARHLSR